MIVSGANGWRIRKRMHGWRSIQIRPTIPLQLPTLQATKAIIDYSSDARAFNANTNFDFNCGPDVHRRLDASHHMVADKKLSTSLQSIPTKQIVIGDGSRLECKQQGDLQLLLHGVLVVPGLDRNLVSVGNTPHTTKWEFDKHGATLRNNNNGDNLLTASARRSLLRQGEPTPLCPHRFHG